VRGGIEGAHGVHGHGALRLRQGLRGRKGGASTMACPLGWGGRGQSVNGHGGYGVLQRMSQIRQGLQGRKGDASTHACALRRGEGVKNACAWDYMRAFEVKGCTGNLHPFTAWDDGEFIRSLD